MAPPRWLPPQKPTHCISNPSVQPRRRARSTLDDVEPLCLVSIISAITAAATLAAGDEAAYTYRWLPGISTRIFCRRFLRATTGTIPHLELFDLVDPGSRTLAHEKPNAFLANVVVSDWTPSFGSDTRGVDLVTLNAVSCDQLALYVARRGVIAFKDQGDFLNVSAERYLGRARYFDR